VGSPNPVVNLVQRLLDPLAVRFGGDHLLRRPDLAVRGAGLDIERLDSSKLGIVLGLAARKPCLNSPVTQND
jgi:hypothetical protein